jgi:hypothetical protein
MHRTSVRGFGFAAATMAVTSLAVGTVGAPASARASAGSMSVADMLVSRQVALVAAWSEAAVSARSKGSWLGLQSRPHVDTPHASVTRRLERMSQIRYGTPVGLGSMHPVLYGTRVVGWRLAAARGWGGAQFECLDQMWTRESGWRVSAYNEVSGAYGIPQAHPGEKMSGAGPGWRTNPATQISWGLTYIARKYGSPCAAWSFWLDHYWY